VRYHANKNTGNILTASGHPLPVFLFGSNRLSQSSEPTASVTFRLRRKSLLCNLSRWSVRYHAKKNAGNVMTASGHPLPVFFFGSELCRLVVN